METDDEFDRVFDLNEDALFALQQQLATYEQQQLTSTALRGSGPMVHAAETLDLATVSAAFEHDDDFFDDDFPLEIAEQTNVNSKIYQHSISRRQSAAVSSALPDEISEQVRRLQYQIQLVSVFDLLLGLIGYHRY